MKWCNVQTNEYDLQATNEYDLQAKGYPTICTHYKLINNNKNKLPVLPECICNKWQQMMQQTYQAHNHGNMITLGKVDTSDLMMIITWARDIFIQSPKLKWDNWTHKTPYIVMKMKGNQ